MSRALSRKVAALTLAAAAGVLGTTLLVSPAHAHHANVVGVGKCDEKTGTWNVKWTVTNDMDIAATISEVVSNPGGLNLPTALPKKSQSNGQVSAEYTVPGNTTQATVTFKVKWANGYPEGGKSTVTGTAKLDGKCVAPTTPPPTTPVATPTPSASTPGLPVTGAPTSALLGTGAALVAGGAALVVVLRRRRRVTFIAD